LCFCGTSWFEVSFGAGGSSFKSVCILAGVIFCLDVGLRGLRLVSVVVERAFCDVLVDVFFDFLFFSRDFLGVRGLLVLDSELMWFVSHVPWYGA
jgi:hypothetical protein